MSKKCTPLWREAHFEVNMLKTLGVRTTFGGARDCGSCQAVPCKRIVSLTSRAKRAPQSNVC